MPPSPAPQILISLADGALDATVVTDRAQTVVHANRAFLNLTGLRERELRTRPRQGVCHSMLKLHSCEEEHGCLSRRAIAANRSLRQDEVRSASGQTFIVSATPLEVLGELFVVESFRDVSAESGMQEEYKTLLERERHRAQALEEQVQARTAELSKSLAQLKEARAQLVHAEKMSSLGTLVAGIAHELNNPINFIYGSVDFIEEAAHKLAMFATHVLEHPDGPALLAKLPAAVRADRVGAARDELGQLLETVREGADRAATIVRDLRVFSHGSTAEKPQTLGEVDLDKGVRLTLQLVGPQAKAAQVTLKTELSGMPPFAGNGPQLNQVVMNLVVNAIQAVGKGGEVTVRTRREDAFVLLDVVDNGPGITPELQEKIFDPFFTTKAVGQGTGLGLSISMGIVKSHSGTLTVTSAPGKGAIFTMRLPVPRKEQAVQ